MKLNQLKQIFVISGGLLFFTQQAKAQSACSSSGEKLNGAIYGPATFAIGDFTVYDAGADPSNINDADLFLSSTANVDIFAELDIEPGAVMRLKAGAVLNIYGNVNNSGSLFVEPGATINFYGDTWKNVPTAVLGDGASASNTLPGGTINFIAPRPAIPSSVNATSCVMSNYSGNNFIQKLDGGTIPMDIALHIQNANNVQLVNTDATIEGLLVFDVNDGNLDLQNQILNFTPNGDWQTNVTPNQAYILTNGTISCDGKVIKKGLLPATTFSFPIGTVESDLGIRDYVPAIIKNDGSTIDSFHVAVKNYTQSNGQGATIFAPEEGMGRTWQITSDGGSPATITLQHNTVTNGTAYNTIGSDPVAFITQYQGAGAWDIGSSGTYVLGDVASSAKHTRSFTSTATTCADDKSWFTKSSDSITPLPINLISFSARASDCKVLLNWEAAIPNVNFNVERQQNANTWEEIGVVKGNITTATSKYSFTDPFPAKENLYRLRIQEQNNRSSLSNVIQADVNCDRQGVLSMAPNPATSGNKVVISSSNSIEQVNVYDAFGRIIEKFNGNGNEIIISTKGWGVSTYYFQIILNNGSVENKKLVIE